MKLLEAAVQGASVIATSSFGFQFGIKNRDQHEYERTFLALLMPTFKHHHASLAHWVFVFIYRNLFTRL